MITKTCVVCGKPFQVKLSRVNRDKRCSRTCQYSIEQLKERFWARVDKSGDCWVWTAGKRHGYGSFWVDGRDTYAHRLAYEWTRGPITEGLDILHLCDNPACCNPDHLQPGTHLDNMRDMYQKGRRKHAKGEHNGNSKLTADQVANIREQHQTGNVTGKQLAHEYGVSATTISAVLRGNTWKS